jgi:hypothetical protein
MGDSLRAAVIITITISSSPFWLRCAQYLGWS